MTTDSSYEMERRLDVFEIVVPFPTEDVEFLSEKIRTLFLRCGR
jgi:hypothetical protein